MRGIVAAVALVSAILWSAQAQAQQPAPSCDEELGQVRVLVHHLRGQRQQVEIEAAREIARLGRENQELRQRVEEFEKVAKPKK